MGYSERRLLARVELPLALPVIMAGLRVATVSTVALVTVGSIVSYGGLGNLLLRAVGTQFKAQILAASLLCVAARGRPRPGARRRPAAPHPLDAPCSVTSSAT